MPEDPIWWPVPSGTTVRIDVSSEAAVPNTARTHISTVVSSTGAESREVNVVFDDPQYVNRLRHGNSLPALQAMDRARLATLAALRATGENPDFFQTPAPLQITLDYDGIRLVEAPTPLDDRGIRHYLARRFYLAWREGGFDRLVELGDEDAGLTGADFIGLLRNIQILEQEGYLTLHRTVGAELRSLRGVGTAKLIREVERYGGPIADVETEPEFEGSVRAVASLQLVLEAILAERARYELARSSFELASVFRAIMPIAEGIVRELLQNHGSTRQHSSLGPMIGELRERSIGSIELWSLLTALQNNVRDILLHGGALPTGTLRVACETCFAVLPMLGRLFRSSV